MSFRNHFPRALCGMILAALSANVLARDAAIKPNDLIGICGDSITEQKIYSAFIEEYILACQPVSHVRVMQFGWSGDTIAQFFAMRLDNDVLTFHPTVVTTCYGMNDGAYSKLTDTRATLYRKTTQNMIDRLKAAGVRTIILGSPGCVGDELKNKPATAQEYNQTLKAFRDIDEDLADKNGILFADVFTALTDAKMKEKAKYGEAYLTNGPDGIHPKQNGHLVMAYAFLKAMGFDGNIGQITVDLGSNTASGSGGHTVVGNSVKNGVVQIDSTRYPFCFYGKPDQPDATTGVISLIPFNQDLNRLTLIVKNCPASRMRVTWGNSSKEFSSVQLAAGINLASEFLENPFSVPFKNLSEAVLKQQMFETPFIKNFMSSVHYYSTIFDPEDLPALNQLVEAGSKKDKRLFETAASQIVPVHHTIKIEAVP